MQTIQTKPIVKAPIRESGILAHKFLQARCWWRESGMASRNARVGTLCATFFGLASLGKCTLIVLCLGTILCTDISHATGEMDVFSVRDFGAKADGKSDDTA